MITKTWIREMFPIFGLFSDQELDNLMVHVLRESQLSHLPVEDILRRIDGEVESEMAQA